MKNLTIEEIRNLIANRAVGHIRECELNGLVMYLVIQSFTGSGKSVSVMKAIDEAGYTWMYFCYSDDTEILTKDRGWVLFKDLTYEDEVACLSKDTHTMYWHKPQAIEKFHFKGNMYRLNHRSIDLLVTPNHNLYLAESRERKGYHFKQIKDIYHVSHILDSFYWYGKEKEYFFIPKYEEHFNQKINDKISMDLWLEFLGWFISEGTAEYNEVKHNYRINIAQTNKSPYIKEIKRVLEQINENYNYGEKAGNFSFGNKQLAKYLKPLGKSYEKYIPQEFMNLSKRQLKILFDAIMKGDGNKNQRRYTTTSKKLADQIQELALKIGYNSTMSIEIRDSPKHHNIYRIYFRNKKHLQIYKNRHISKEEYDGVVYCCTVPENIVCVRRNGRTTFCGNSPFHDIIKENLEYSKLRNYDFIHMKGKDQEGVCFSPEYREYVKKGISITPFCETRCKLRHDGCPYYETKDLIESFPYSWAGVHAHIPTYLQTFLYEKKYERRRMFNYYDIIIIDEFPFQCLFNQVVVSKGDIDHLRNVLSYMNDSDEKWFVSNFLEELSLSTDHININYHRIGGLIKSKRSYKLDKFYEDYEKTLLELISNKTIQYPPKQILFNIRMIYEQNPNIETLKWILYRHKWDGWSKSGIYITTSNIEYFKNLPIPIVALDATADINAWNTLLNDNCLHTKIDIEYKNLYQLQSNGRYPVSTWINVDGNEKVLSDAGKRLCNLIIQICKRKERAVLICSNKRIKKRIEEYLNKHYKKKNYEFAIYYNLRSRNEFYQNCDTCIISHEPNIPPLQLEIMHNVIDWDIALLNELMTTSEIKQAIGRIRQNILETPSGIKRENVEIYLFPGALTDDAKVLDEAKLVNYDNMYVGKLVSVRDILMEILKEVNSCSLSSLRKATKDICSYNILKSEITKLYLDGYVSDYRNNIEWIWNEEKARQPIYKVLR